MALKNSNNWRWIRGCRLRLQACPTVLLILLATVLPLSAQKRVPPKRSSQIEDGFGINSDLPRDPYLPWDRHWWTRMFDAGVSWIRIGQYENTSDPHQLGLDRAEARRSGDSSGLGRLCRLAGG